MYTAVAVPTTPGLDPMCSQPLRPRYRFKAGDESLKRYPSLRSGEDVVTNRKLLKFLGGGSQGLPLRHEPDFQGSSVELEGVICPTLGVDAAHAGVAGLALGQGSSKSRPFGRPYHFGAALLPRPRAQHLDQKSASMERVERLQRLDDCVASLLEQYTKLLNSAQAAHPLDAEAEPR